MLDQMGCIVMMHFGGANEKLEARAAPMVRVFLESAGADVL
jgi:hypothetical protein